MLEILAETIVIQYNIKTIKNIAKNLFIGNVHIFY